MFPLVLSLGWRPGRSTAGVAGRGEDASLRGSMAASCSRGLEGPA